MVDREAAVKQPAPEAATTASTRAAGDQATVLDLGDGSLRAGASGLTAPQVLALQRSAGNRAVERIFAPGPPVVQPARKRSREEKAPSADVEGEEDSDPGGDSEMNEGGSTTTLDGEGTGGGGTGPTTSPGERSLKRAKSADLIDVEHAAPPPPLPRTFERESQLGFWMRTSVRARDPGTPVDPATVTVHDISISPERRMTAFGQVNRGLQGAHIVAWSAMLRSWNAQLKGPLPQVTALLRDWLLQDYTADSPATRDASAAKRAHALRLVDRLALPQSVNTLFDRLEQAIALFIESNQQSSFVTQGESHGGRDEAGGHAALERLDSQAKDPTNHAMVTGQVLTEALKLVDLSRKSFGDLAMSKVVSTWYRMLEALYPQLRPLLPAAVGPHLVGARTVTAWVDMWDTSYAAGRAASERALTATEEEDETAYAATGGVAITARSTEPGAARLLALKAGDVKIAALDIPAKLRAPTQFGATQQSHTLAWTYLRQSLIAQFKEIQADRALDELEKLAKRDKESLSHGRRHPATTVARSTNLCAEINHTKATVLPLDEWVVTLNRLLLEFVAVNQLLPTSTYGAAGQALGHGEAGANRAFAADMALPTAEELAAAEKRKEEDAAFTASDTFDDAIRKAAKYMDLGLFYMPLVNEAGEFASYQTRREPLRLRFDGSLGDPDPAAAPVAPSPADEEAVEAQIRHFFLHDKLTATAWRPLKEMSVPAFNSVGNRIAQLQMEAKALAQDKAGTVKLGPRLFSGELLTDPSDEIRENELAELAKMTARLGKIAERLRSYRKLNPAVVRTDQERTTALHRKLSKPKERVAGLYTENGYIINKVVGDYFHHLKYFKPGFHDLLKGSDDGKKRLLKIVLTDPLDPSEVRIGQPLKIHLMDDYEPFMRRFRTELVERIPDWTAAAFPDP